MQIINLKKKLCVISLATFGQKGKQVTSSRSMGMLEQLWMLLKKLSPRATVEVNDDLTFFAPTTFKVSF